MDRQVSEHRVTDTTDPFLGSPSITPLKCREPEIHSRLLPQTERPTAGAPGFPGAESNSAQADHLSSTRRGGIVDESQMTFEKFVERKFLPEYVASKRPSGQAFYQAMLKHVLAPEAVDRMLKVNSGKQVKKMKAIPGWPYLGNMKLCDVRPDDICQLLSVALAHGYSIQTVKHIRNVIGAIFSHAKEVRCLVGSNPVSQVKPPKQRRRQVVELTPAQAVEALGIMQYPEREMTLIGIFTGMSPAEIIGLQWAQVNLTNEQLNEYGMPQPPRTICVRKRWYRGKSERVRENCVRDLPITPPLLRILQRLRRKSRSQDPEECILLSEAGTPINQSNLLNRRLRPIAKQLGVFSLSWQAFRRTHDRLASELEKEFRFSAPTFSTRISTENAENHAWTPRSAQTASM
jgi:integrase